jgi:hypothetical protein
MGRVKAHYHDHLTLLGQQQPHEVPTEQMTEAELETYLDLLYEDFIISQEAYRYEDNYKPFGVRKAR